VVNLSRKFAGENQRMWDWELAKVPLLTQEMEAVKQQKKGEKLEKQKNIKKQQQQQQQQQNNNNGSVNNNVNKKSAKKNNNNTFRCGNTNKNIQQQKDQKTKEELLKEKVYNENLAKVELEREQSLLMMTDSEKRLLMFDAKSQKQLCQQCQKPITTAPFERLNYKYCTTKCVKEHMIKLEAANNKK
jgi:hypothetical protein